MKNQADRLRIAVVGTGGVGGLLGALLARGTEDVTFVATEATAAALAREGLTVRSARYGGFHVSVVAVTLLDNPVDVCVVAVKASQLNGAMDRVPPMAVADGLVVPMLNGIEHVERLRAVYGNRVIPATMRVASTRVAPTIIEHASPFLKVELALDDDPGRSRLARRFQRHLEAGGVDVDLRHDEVTMLWEKLIFLAPFALLTTRYSTCAGGIRTAHRDELTTVIHEIETIAKAAGADVQTDSTVEFFDSVPATMQSSMQHDAEAGRPIEIDAIGRAVLRAAARAGITAPALEQLVDNLGSDEHG